MRLGVGTRLGPYDIVSLVGAGGMGEVYRAHDVVLKRQVALKVLPPEVANDPDRVARFQREAEVLAALNHPNIAHLYGIEKSNGTLALVMELVEGPTLADRIAKGPIPLDEALPIARQIAEGLEAAHEQGIIHRDLKPANIKVRDDGTVKVLDFGLAKAVERTGPSTAASLTNSPTITSPALITGVGVLLGTAAYMSPEQAKGQPSDKRSDVWAFGAVLYETLTGRRCFKADDVSDTLAAILRADPDWAALPPDTPPAIRRLLRRSLEKDVRLRLSDMAMARVELRDAETEPREQLLGSPASASSRVSASRRFLPYAAAIAVAVVTGFTVWRLAPPADVSAPLARFSLDVPPEVAAPFPRRPLAISPDGTRIVYTTNQRLYLRELGQLEAVRIAGTDAVGSNVVILPFFSPDGQWVGFWTAGQLRKVPVNGGSAVTICDVSAPPVGVSWEADDRILFGAGSIQSVPANGGAATPLASIPNARLTAPHLLPGDGWLLFVLHPSNTAPDQGQVVAQALATGERRVLIEGARDAWYAPSGHIVFARGSALLAQAFDANQVTLRGDAVPIVDSVANAENQSDDAYAALSAAGTLIYLPRAGTVITKLVRLTRDGTAAALAEVPGMAWFPRFSPDGTRVAYGRSGGPFLGDAADLWVIDIARGASTRVTFTGNNRFYPIWTKDGTRLTFGDGVDDTNRVLWTAADGSGKPEVLMDTGPRRYPSSWSPDGRTLAFYLGPAGTSTNSRDLWLLHLDGDKRTTEAFVQTPFEERGAIFSPNGRWIAYVSNKSGQSDIYARPYPGPGGEVTLSVGGGQEPAWAPSGREMFYRHDGKLLSVSIAEHGSTLTVGSPTTVFPDAYRLDTGGAMGGMANYDVSPDGKQFVMVEEPKASGGVSAHLQVVLNWQHESKRGVPAK